MQLGARMRPRCCLARCTSSGIACICSGNRWQRALQSRRLRLADGKKRNTTAYAFPPLLIRENRRNWPVTCRSRVHRYRRTKWMLSRSRMRGNLHWRTWKVRISCRITLGLNYRTPIGEAAKICAHAARSKKGSRGWLCNYRVTKRFTRALLHSTVIIRILKV